MFRSQYSGQMPDESPAGLQNCELKKKTNENFPY